MGGRAGYVAWVAAGLIAGCGAAAPAGRAPAVRAAETVPARPRVDDGALEAEVVALVNRHRGTHGLRSLAPEPRIGREAREHSAAMAAGTVPLGHDGFVARIAELGRSCRQSAENVAFNQGARSPASEAVAGWLRSSRHRTNIEGPYEATGVGVASNAEGEIYFTQIFVGGCGAGSSP